MGKSLFILLCMLCRSFIFCTAQQVDMLHNMFRSGDVIKKEICSNQMPLIIITQE